MTTWVDGNNLLGIAERGPRSEGDRERLLHALLRLRLPKPCTVVFDGPPPRPAVSPEFQMGGTGVVYSGKRSADEVILSRVRPGDRVVTADRDLAIGCRGRRARAIAPAEFLKSASRRTPETRGEKPSETAVDVQEWMDYFGKGRQNRRRSAAPIATSLSRRAPVILPAGGRIVDVPNELIERLQSKDPEAFAEFMERYGRQLLRFGVRMCGDRDDAREVVQDTLLKTFASVHELKSREAFVGWLYRIATNACLMKRRKSKFLEEEVPLEEVMPDRAALAQGGPSWNRLPDQAALDGELQAKISQAILDLPDGYRSVLVLRDMEGLDTEEVAQALGLSKDVVKMRLHRARAKVRNQIEAYLTSGAA